jgi:tetratricopeptide (TPR) repeat protein
VYAERLERPGWERGSAPFVVVFNLLSQGKLRETLRRLEEFPFPREFVAVVMLLAAGEGLPVPQERIEDALALQFSDGLPDASMFYGAIYAIDRGRRADAEEAMRRVRAAVPKFLAAGDTASARVAEEAAAGVEGYALARGGDVDAGLEKLQTAVREVSGYEEVEGMNALLRWVTADVLQEAGRWEEARPYLESFEPDPRASLRLARLHEELGEFDEAREAYERFAYAWRNADPELQPMVQEARAAARRLTSVTRE